MATFFMLGTYTYEAVKEIHPERTAKAKNIIAAMGGEVKGMYSVVGAYDLILVVELPGHDEAVKTTVDLHMLTGIRFSTFQAVPVEYFDVLISEGRTV